MIHTNKFLTTKLPSDFILENFGVIGSALKGVNTRNTKYTVNKWYVEAVTITNDGSTAKMEIGLNPFASSISSYKDNYKSFVKAYTDATKKTTTIGASGNTTTSKAKSKSTGSKTLDSVVDKAIKGKTNALDKAKAIDKAFKAHVIYSFYYNADKTKGKKTNFESAWKNGKLNCADGANILCAMYIYAGFTAVIIHVPKGGASKYGHYIVRVTVNGKYYYTDNAASSGKHTSRSFGKVWNGRTKGTNKGTIVT